MRQIIALLIALLACAVIMPAMCAPVVTPTNQPAPLLDPGQTQLSTTSSIAAFLSDDWLPTPFLPEIITSASNDAKRKSTTQDINKTKKSNLTTTTFAIQDFLNDAWMPPAYVGAVDFAPAAKKGGALKQSVLAIEQFLDDNWTPGTPVVAVSDGTGYQKGQMG